MLTIAFRYADEHDLLLLDLEDLQAMLAWCADNADELSSKYGNVTKASVGSIHRTPPGRPWKMTTSPPRTPT